MLLANNAEENLNARDTRRTETHHKSMKAAVYSQYGTPDVLQFEDVAKPTPRDSEVLIKIEASSVTTADGMMRTGTPWVGRLFIGLLKPKNPIPGTGLAGVIESVGKDVTLFKQGDHVFGEIVFGLGTNAEYVCVPEDGVLAEKPDNITFEEAAPVCDGAMTSLNFLRDMANIQRGQKVLVIGASGSLGTAAVQLAKHFQAEVTAVCSTTNLDLVKDLGANHVIDYTKQDFSKNNLIYDIIYDTIGKHSFSHCKNSLAKNGIYLSPVLGWPLLFQMLLTSMIGNKKAMFSATGIRPVVELRILLNELKELISSGDIKTVIDRRYSLHQIVAAHRYVEKGHKIGNVVLSVNHS